MVFLKKKKSFQNLFLFFLPFFYATFQCGRYGVFKKKFKNFLTQKKWKNRPKKLLIIGPDPFISQSIPDQRPPAQNWFFILWNLGTRHLFSYLWYYHFHLVKVTKIQNIISLLFWLWTEIIIFGLKMMVKSGLEKKYFEIPLAPSELLLPQIREQMLVPDHYVIHSNF